MPLSKFQQIEALPSFAKRPITYGTAFRIGCPPCKAECAGTFMVDANTGKSQKDLLATLEVAVLETGIPVEAMTDKDSHSKPLGDAVITACSEAHACHTKAQYMKGVTEVIRIAARDGTEIRF